jgi:hypothetical protein
VLCCIDAEGHALLANQQQIPMQVTHQHLQQRPAAFWQGLGRRVLHLTWSSRGEVVLDEALGLQVCPSAKVCGAVPPHLQVLQVCLPPQALCALRWDLMASIRYVFVHL